ncbi:condensin-2 complex subunit G2-like isoform X2 [Cimex lectularius]|uniref:Uncharacterized protein n=1 Tax=Cimex lectularius TaxID=79782 RepID=A0A8I6SP91_CIMLE|nr:condensin-2 complex subunit G2-like isoform X2 [Cimex lectularius]
MSKKDTVKKKKKPKENKEDWMDTITALTDLPTSLHKFIEDKIDFTKCDEDLLKGFFKELKTYMIKQQNILDSEASNEEKEKSNNILYALCKFVSPIFKEMQFLKGMVAMRVTGWMNVMLADANLDLRMRELLCQFSINHLQATPIYDHLHEGIYILDYLLDLTLGEANTNQREINNHIRHLMELKDFIKTTNFMGEPMDIIRSKLLKCVTSRNFLKSKEGTVWAGIILSREISHVRSLQQKIRDFLITLSKKEAGAYADIYFYGWANGDEDIKREIEENCIQDLMKRIFTLRRNGIDMGRTGKLVFSVLQNLHTLRTSKKFSEVITKLYTPLLWRYLRSANPAERCNAAEVFLDVFPLEKVGSVGNASFKDRQVKEIKDLLTDDCHIVRIIAVKGTCYHLAQSVTLLTLMDIKQFFEIIVDKLANDGSTYLVRVAVFVGISTMLEFSTTHGILFNVLPKMYLHIHDENEQVRKAFVKMLIKVRNLKDCSFSYWDIVPIEHIVARLENEGPIVGTELAKLIIPDFYKKNQTIDKTINNFKKIIKLNKEAAKNLFKHSNGVLNVHDAFAIIVTVIGVLRKILKEHTENPNTENINPEEGGEVLERRVRVKKRRRLLKNITNTSIIQENSSPQNENSGSELVPTFFKNISLLEEHEILACEYSLVIGMVSAVTILWAIFSEELIKNEKYLSDLYDLSTCAVPMLLRYYKGTLVYYYIVDFASLTPINKLNPVSTIASACISELKEITDQTPSNLTQVLISALSSWDRGLEVIDLIIEWLNHAFRQKNLNMTLDMEQNSNKKSKVRFKPVKGKPLLALTLLSHLVDDIFNLKRLLHKRRFRLYELHTYMARIKIILENRVQAGEELKEPELSDIFICKCFKYYVFTGIVLHQSEQQLENGSNTEVSSLNAHRFCIDITDWATRIIVPFLPTDLEEDGKNSVTVRCINHILENSNYIISISQTDMEHSVHYASFLSNLLNSGCPLLFIENAAKGIKELCEYAQVYISKDEYSLYKTIFPSLQSRLLEILAMSDLSTTSIKNFVEDVKGFNAALFSLLTVTYSKFPDSELFSEVYSYYIYAVIQAIAKQIIKENTVICEKKIGNHVFIVKIILNYFISKPVFLKRIFPVLDKHLILYKSEGTNLLSCVAIVYTLVHLFKAKSITSQDLEIESCLKNIYECLKAFSSAPVEDSFYTEPLDVAKNGFAVLKEAAILTSFAFNVQ